MERAHVPQARVLQHAARRDVHDHRGRDDEGGFPFLSPAGLTFAYLGWVVVWVALMLALAASTFLRRDL